MIRILMAIVVLASAPLAAQATEKACRAEKDTVDCLVRVWDKGGTEYYRKEVTIELFSSTFLCDGRNNRFYYEEFKIDGTDKKVAIYGGWDSHRLAFYDQSDTKSLTALSQGYFPRGRQLNEGSSLDALLDGKQFFVTCETVANGYE